MSTGASKPPDGVGNEQKPEDSNQVVDKLKQELDSTKYELAVALAVLEASSNKCTELERELESSKQTAAKNLKDAEDDHSGEIKKIKQALDWGLADGCLIRRLPSPSNHIIAKLKAANAALQTKINEGQAEVNKARKSNEEVDQIRKDANKAISRLSHENAHLNRQLNEDTRRKNALAEIEKLKAVLDAKTATPEKTTDAKDTKEANTESAPRYLRRFCPARRARVRNGDPGLSGGEADECNRGFVPRETDLWRCRGWRPRKG